MVCIISVSWSWAPLHGRRVEAAQGHLGGWWLQVSAGIAAFCNLMVPLPLLH